MNFTLSFDTGIFHSPFFEFIADFRCATKGILEKLGVLPDVHCIQGSKSPNGRRCRPMCCGRATKRDALPFSCFVFIQVCYLTKPSFSLNFPTKPPKIARLWFRRVFARPQGQTRHTGRNTALLARIKLTMQQCK